jgi:hypothetical protein
MFGINRSLRVFHGGKVAQAPVSVKDIFCCKTP